MKDRLNGQDLVRIEERVPSKSEAAGAATARALKETFGYIGQGFRDLARMAARAGVEGAKATREGAKVAKSGVSDFSSGFVGEMRPRRGSERLR